MKSSEFRNIDDLNGSVRPKMNRTMNATRRHDILLKLNPSFRFRHEVFNATLRELLTPKTRWVDIGCGNNEIIAEYGNLCGLAVGLDIVPPPHRRNAPFIQADLKNIPLPDAFADVITLRMVVEHIHRIPKAFSDVERILKKGGKLLMLTTNVWSPVVFITKMLPHRLKKRAIRRCFHLEEQHVLPVYHRFNSPRRIKKGIGNLRPVHLAFIEQTTLSNPILFWVFFVPFLLTNNEWLKPLRSNILALFEKS